jgi:hypothetical protein
VSLLRLAQPSHRLQRTRVYHLSFPPKQNGYLHTLHSELQNNSKNETRFKTRLAARGYGEVENENILSGSPVASALLTDWFWRKMASASGYCTHGTPKSDSFLAFPEGKYIDGKCIIVLLSPDDYAVPAVVWRLKNPIYGLCSASMSW